MILMSQFRLCKTKERKKGWVLLLLLPPLFWCCFCFLIFLSSFLDSPFPPLPLPRVCSKNERKQAGRLRFPPPAACTQSNASPSRSRAPLTSHDGLWMDGWMDGWMEMMEQERMRKQARREERRKERGPKRRERERELPAEELNSQPSTTQHSEDVEDVKVHAMQRVDDGKLDWFISRMQASFPLSVVVHTLNQLSILFHFFCSREGSGMQPINRLLPSANHTYGEKLSQSQ